MTLDKSIAVLPFENLSADRENAFFADGIQDNILTDLSKVADLKVISRSSVMQYRDTKQSMQQIASALHVSYLLEGSAQKANGRLRVNVQPSMRASMPMCGRTSTIASSRMFLPCKVNSRRRSRRS